MITQIQQTISKQYRATFAEAFSTGYKAETLFYLTQPKRQRFDDSKETLLNLTCRTA
jgi:hypothetical protein